PTQIPYPPVSGTPSIEWPAPQFVKEGDPVDLTVTYANQPYGADTGVYLGWYGTTVKLVGSIFGGSGTLSVHIDHMPLTTALIFYTIGAGTDDLLPPTPI